jgi:3-oxoacyl-[acyl-carrier protein] reductase
VKETVDRVVEFGSVDILINNADHVGQFTDQNPDLKARPARQSASASTAQAVWPHMKERQWGRIINISVAGTLGGFGQASCSTTKAGILGRRGRSRWRAQARDHVQRDRARSSALRRSASRIRR